MLGNIVQIQTRPVHKSVWVEFVPNLKLTQILWVYHLWTRHRPVKGVYLGGRTSSDTSRSLVGVEIYRIILESVEIHQICTKSSWICWDLAESRQDQAKSRRDLARFRRDQAISQLIGPKRLVKRSHWWKTTTFPM